MVEDDAESFLGGAIELKKMKTKRAHKVEEMRKAMETCMTQNQIRDLKQKYKSLLTCWGHI